MTETQKAKEGDELHETEQGRTLVELVRDNGVELVECIGTWCEHQDSLPQEQREMVCSLEADRDQVSPVEPCEVDQVYGANEYTWSLGGYGNPGISCSNTNPRCDCPGVCVEMCAECE